MATNKERQINRDKQLEDAVKSIKKLSEKIEELIALVETLKKGKK